MRYNHFSMLPEEGFKHCGDKRIRPQGGDGGGGSSQPQNVTQTTSNIPDWLQGPTQAMVSRGELLSQQGYTPYYGERVAGFTPAQEAAFQQVYNLKNPEQYAQAGQSIAGAQNFGATGAMNAMGYKPGTFGTAQANQYMSPYQQAVTDIAKREAIGEAALMNRELAAKAAKAGAFGGSRFGVEQALLGSKLATNLSDIQTKGSQDAFLNAQQQFERDRAAGLQGANLNLQGAQFGAQTGLQAGTQLANLGTAQQAAELNRIQALAAAGEQQQGLQQQRLNTAYQNYLEQRDWEKNQLGYLSGLIRGTPFSTTQTQSTTASQPSTQAQLLSAGLGVAGLASLLKKEGGKIDKTEGLSKKDKRKMMGEGLPKMNVHKMTGGA